MKENNRFNVFIAFILALILNSYNSYISAEWSQSFNYRGEWSSWNKEYGRIFHYEDESGIILKTDGGLKYFEFKITNYVAPTKKQLKEHLKSGEWFEYTGVVKYCVNDNYPNAESLAKANLFVMPSPRTDVTPTVMRETTCIIRVQPYKKLPSTYNVFFDEIGVAIDISGVTFSKQKKHTNGGRVVANIAQSIFLFPIGIGSWWWNPVREYDER